MGGVRSNHSQTQPTMTTQACAQSFQRDTAAASHFRLSLCPSWSQDDLITLAATIVGAQSVVHRSAPETIAGHPSASAKPRV